MYNAGKELGFNDIVLDLISLAQTAAGKEKAKRLSPDLNKAQIERIYNETEEIIQTGEVFNLPYLENIYLFLKKKLPINEKKLLLVKQEIDYLVSLNYILKTTKVSFIKKLISHLSSLKPLTKYLNSIFDDEGIKDNATEELFSVRKKITSTRKHIINLLENFINSHSSLLNDRRVFFRSNRYQIGVKPGFQLNGIVDGISSSGHTIFFEPHEVALLNNQLKLFEDKEHEELNKIIEDVASVLKENRHIIETYINTVAYIDIINARMKWAKKNNAKRIVLSSKINLKNAKHPVLMKYRKVVPFNLKLEEHILLISGPNAGGKTVLLKTLGLFAMLIKAGLFLTCDEGSTFPFFKDVFVILGDEQSIEENLSTFSATILHIKNILNKANSKSLVLIDEIGSTTSPEEGAALGMAFLKRLRDNQAYTIATTHLDRLKYFVYKENEMINGSMEFKNGPTYKFIMGIPAPSNGIAIAQELGLEQNIIEEAKSYLNKNELALTEMLKEVVSLKNKYQKELENIIKEKEKITREKEELNELKTRLLKGINKRFKDFESRKRKEIERMKKDFHSLLNELNKNNTKEQRKKILSYINNIKLKHIKEHNPHENKPIFKKGQRVNINGKTGLILEDRDKEGFYLVQIGALKIKVYYTEIDSHNKEDSPSGKIETDEYIFKPVLHIRGMRFEDAYIKLVDFFEEAKALGINEVMVIHGKGMGILKNMVIDYARKTPWITSFRAGYPEEGDGGVTVLTIKP